jgi:hypothetical protein
VTHLRANLRDASAPGFVGVPADSKSSLYAQGLHKILQTIN